MACKLADVATVTRTKGFQPDELTLDVVFTDRESYEEAVAQKVLNRSLVAHLYGVSPSDVLDLTALDPTSTVRITIRQPNEDRGTDAGVQQDALLLSVTLDLGP
jgi:hypothetical protein